MHRLLLTAEENRLMRLYDPTSSRPQRVLSRAAAIASLEGRTIGVLENGKLNAVEMLREVAALFQERHGCMLRALYSKSNAYCVSSVALVPPGGQSCPESA
jgi:hypothetical protein